MTHSSAVPEGANEPGPAVPARISLVTLGCTDLKALRAFYRRLGWPEANPAEESVAFFRLAGSILSLYPLDELAADATVPLEAADSVDEGGAAVRSSRTLAINVASPAEVEQVLAAVATAGGSIVKPGRKVFWGGFSGYFADPEGNLWEVAHNPFWPLDERGLPVIPE